MSGKSDDQQNLVSGIIIGFLGFALFGLATFVILNLTNLKKPTDRIYSGDFSKEVQERRDHLTGLVRSAQTDSLDESKLSAAMSAFKPAAQSASGNPVDPIFLPKPMPAAAPVASPKKVQPKPAPKPEVKPAPKGKGKAKAAPKAKGKAKAKADSKGKGKGEPN